MAKSLLLQEIIREVTGGELIPIEDINQECKNQVFENQQKIIKIFQQRIKEKTISLLAKLDQLESQLNEMKQNSEEIKLMTFDDQKFSASNPREQLQILEKYIQNTLDYYN